MKKLIALLSVVLTLTIFVSPVFSKTEVQLEKEIAELEAKLKDTQAKANTLKSQIAYYDGQIQLTTLKITQTEELITSLTSKIVTLEESLEKRSKVLEKQVVTSYKSGAPSPLPLLLSSSDFSHAISKFKYMQIIQSNNRKFIYDTQKTQSNYSDQKDLITASRKKLEVQKVSLNNTRIERDTLLKSTKNDEATYQKLLAQAKSERDSFRAFTRGAGLLPPQPQPDGWFFSQRDERWGRQCIGTTCSWKEPSYVVDVGCLVTSVAMLQKKNGVDTNPAAIARERSYFIEDLMDWPWPAQSGFIFTRFWANKTNIIESELSAGRPVIVEITMSGVQGGRHFLVLKSKSGSSYKMNDPFRGYDLTFQDYYSTSSIVSVSTYTKT